MDERLNLDNPIFDILRTDFAYVMDKLVKTMIETDKSTADVTIKFTLDLKKIFTANKGELTFPTIRHKINCVTKSEYKLSGESANGYVIGAGSDGGYVITKYDDGQIDMDDLVDDDLSDLMDDDLELWDEE